MFMNRVLVFAMLLAASWSARASTSVRAGGEAQAAPAAENKPADSTPVGTNAAPPAEAKPGDAKKKAPAKPKHKGSGAVKPEAPAPDGEPRKIVVRQGSTSEPVAQIFPGMTQEEADRQRAGAEQLLATAEADLKRLSERSLAASQQATIVQIRQYMDVARTALQESDPQRAHTLAQKAYLLADDLVKH